ncbi:hypothetical protein CMK12_06575 [Candidatus Poribacteria bacterium]|jgi:hypothetical protein|nr:hypothetical protein [Candidatus Poribacteria bacterium]MDP6746626.1 hypothetical protein [Candidatus Poribacteria bacterium]
MPISNPTSSRTITKKAVIVGLILVIINAYWVGIASELWYAVYTLVSPFSNAVFSLAVLLLVNAILKRYAKPLVFTPAELLLTYAMVTMVSTISGHAMMAILMGGLAHPFWFASPENEWTELFLHYIPSWLTVHQTDPLRGYYEGRSSIFLPDHLRAWLVPVLAWSGFILVLYSSLLCIGLILRKQWMEREKLSFPLTHLPIQMTMNSNFFKLKTLWIGFAISAVIRFVNGVHDIFPALPGFPANFRLDRFFTDKPWNAIGYSSMSFNLAIIGLTYFMPLDLAFSTWFFFWLTRAERVTASMVGVNIQDLHLNDRATGGWIGIAIIALWGARRHLSEFIGHLVGRFQVDDSREPFSFRTLMLITLLCIGLVFTFCYLAGMSLWAMAVFYLIFLMFALAIGRVRAELGPPYHEVIGINPRQMMVDLFGTRRLGVGNLTVISFLYAFNRCNRSHPMPNQVESLRIGERSKIPGFTLILALALAIGVGAFATFWSYLEVMYRYGLDRCHGAIGHFGWETFNPLQNWLQHPREVETGGVVFMGIGLGFVFFLQFLRSHFMWWPLHASGYVLSGASWGGLIYFWFPVMVSWLAKALILKFAGWQMHRKLEPFFLGLVLGDYIPRSILSILSFILNLYMPSSGAGHTL